MGGSFAKARARKAGEPVDRGTLLALSAGAGVVAGLCCLPPIVLVLLALTNVSLAASIGDVLYGGTDGSSGCWRCCWSAWL